MKFAMFYRDETIHGDTEDYEEVVWRVPRAWLSAPVDGVQTVGLTLPDNRFQSLHGQDIYCVMQTGQPMATSDLGVITRLAGIAKYGLWIPNEEYEAVQDRVNEYRKEAKSGILCT